MIKCDGKTVEIDGSLMECAAEYGMVAEGIISSAKKIQKEVVAAILAEMLRTAIKNTIGEGGDKNEKSKQST